MYITFQDVKLIKSDKRELFNASFSLLRGAILIVRGKNGVGKTSFLRMLAGIQQPFGGSILICGTNISDIRKPYVGYVGHANALKKEMSVYENVILAGTLYDYAAPIIAAIAHMGIKDIIHTKVSRISAGMKKRVAIARLIASNTLIWLLDEPESGLDSKGLELLDKAIITRANTGGIVIMSSHMQNRFLKATEFTIKH